MLRLRRAARRLHAREMRRRRDQETDVTGHTTKSSGQARARRIEQVYDEVANLPQGPGVASRLRTSPAATEWSAIQTLGHMIEMIPHWLHHCRMLIEATGLPTFGRTQGSLERLAGVTHGASADLDALLRQLHVEVRGAASAIRRLSTAERSKRDGVPRGNTYRLRTPPLPVPPGAAPAGLDRSETPSRRSAGAEVIRLARTQRLEAGSRS